MAVTPVQECSVKNCSFNHDGCHAQAITVSNRSQGAACATFIDTSVSGSLPKVLATVGACQRQECRFNDHLLCSAPAVRVGPGVDEADCLTFRARSA